MTITSAIQKVEAFCHACLPAEERDKVQRVSIYTWETDAWPAPIDGVIGVRVAEVTLVGVPTSAGQGFSSFMQSDPECLGVILAAERLILAHIDADSESPLLDEEEIGRSEWLLRTALGY